MTAAGLGKEHTTRLGTLPSAELRSEHFTAGTIGLDAKRS